MPKNSPSIVALIALLIGIISGSSVALAHTPLFYMVSGLHVYETANTHEGLYPYYEYDTSHAGTAENDFTEFTVNYTLHENGDAGDDTDIRFGGLWIWDAQSHHDVYHDDFHCQPIEGVYNLQSTYWNYDELGGNNNGVGFSQYIWNSSVEDCPGAIDGLGRHEMGIEIP